MAAFHLKKGKQCPLFHMWYVLFEVFLGTDHHSGCKNTLNPGQSFLHDFAGGGGRTLVPPLIYHLGQHQWGNECLPLFPCKITGERMTRGMIVRKQDTLCSPHVFAWQG